MRIAFSAAVGLVAVSLAVTACGDSTPSVYGTYDFVSINGEPLPTEGVIEGRYEMKEDGTGDWTLELEGVADPFVSSGVFSVGTMADGCTPLEGEGKTRGNWTASICGDILTTDGPEQIIVMKKR